MGCWGVYDDENDNVADIWIDIENKVMPKCFHDMENEIKHNLKGNSGNDSSDKYMALNIIRRTYGVQHPDKIYDAVTKWLNSNKKTLKDMNTEDNSFDTYHSDRVGVCLKTIRFIEELPASDPLGSGIFSSPMPKHLPKKYPELLRIEALKSLNILIENIDNNLQGWKNLKERKKALQEELLLFNKKHITSNNRKGSKKGSNNSRKTSANRKGTKKRSVNRKGSKKSSKKGSNTSYGSRKNSKKGSRKGPQISATIVKTGTIKKGADGYKWINKKYETKNGIVKRWVRIN